MVICPIWRDVYIKIEEYSGEDVKYKKTAYVVC